MEQRRNGKKRETRKKNGAAKVSKRMIRKTER